MKTTVDIDLTPRQLAEAFAELMDEAQAQFFIEVAAIAQGWDGPAGYQWALVGGHLATCACSTQAARDMVRDLADGIADAG